MDVRRKMVMIVTASILLTAIPGAALIYNYAQKNTLEVEAATLEKTTAVFATSAMQRFNQSAPKLSALAAILQKDLAKPVRPDELTAFHHLIEQNADGVWRNRNSSYDGLHEAGIFLPPNRQESDVQKVRHLRIKTVMDTFGAAASKPLENVWYLSPQRSEIIFDRSYPAFVFEQKADNDYTETPWLTYASPQLNPHRELRFTPPLYDPVPKVWMVSALYPLYIDDQWMGSVGEDMQLTSVLEAMFVSSQIFNGVQHFLLDAQNNYILAGAWQKQLESTPDSFRPDLSREPQLAALLKTTLTDTPRTLDKELLLQGRRFVVTGLRLQPLGWRYYRLTPVDEILAHTRRLIMSVVGMILLATVLTGGIIGTALGRSITRRIKNLSNTMRGYALDHASRFSELGGQNDEIAEAAQVFNRMADGLDQVTSDRLAAETALRENEERLNFAFEGSGDGMWDWKIATGEVYFSKRWKEMLGFSEGEISGSLVEWEKRVHPDDLSQVMADIEAYFAGVTSSYANEHRVLCKDGSYKWILDRGIAVNRDADNRPNRMLGTHTDITARKAYEKTLQESEARLRAVMDNSPFLIWLKDRDGRYLSVNIPWLKSAQLSSMEDVMGKTDLDLWPSELAEKYRADDTEVISTRKQKSTEEIALDGDREYWSETFKSPIIDSSGNVLGTAGFSRDITARRMAENTLRASEKKLSDILDNVDAFIYLKDEEGRYLFANRAVRELFDSSMEQVVGKTDANFFDEVTVRQLQETDRPVLQDGTVVRTQETNTNIKDGSVSTYLSVKLPLRDETGKIYALCGISTDISAQKLTEQALQQAKESAEALARSKTEFLANMSHEIRTPMNAIIGLSQLALNKEVSGEVRDYLQKINISSESLLGILNEILDFSKLEAGKVATEKSCFNLDAMLKNLHILFSARAADKHLAFSIVLAPDVPLDLIGDAMRIQQILSNLLGNAIKFTESGEVQLQVKLQSVDQSTARINFSVQDTGIGITAQDQNKLFQPFSQADGSITRRFGGTGLGLAISNKLLQLMSSECRVRSAPGQGSTFSFELLLDVAASGQSRARDVTHADHTAGDLGKELQQKGAVLSGSHILVTEDNIINQQVVTEFLKLSGVLVDIANNGKEALQLMEQNNYDAILMDVHMPVMGGVEASRLIRRQSRFAALPIIALTAGVTQEERETCLASGMNDVVTKPINPVQLITTLAYWMQDGKTATATGNVDPRTDAAHPEAFSPGSLPGFDLMNLTVMLGGNQLLIQELLLVFHQDMAGIPDDINAALASGDFISARQLAHTIKGAAGNMGAMGLHDISSRLEAQFKSGALEANILQEFHNEFAACMSVIEHLRHP